MLSILLFYYIFISREKLAQQEYTKQDYKIRQRLHNAKWRRTPNIPTKRTKFCSISKLTQPMECIYIGVPPQLVSVSQFYLMGPLSIPHQL